MIKVEHLYKNYSDKIKVLKDISFTFEDGKTYAIIGSSGGGKSTFIRCLNMLEEPTSGTITLDDEVVNSPSTDLTKIREKMGMVFQNFNLFSHMDVKKNVAYALMKVKGMDETSAYKKAIELLGNVGLSHRVDSYPHQLSGGEKQRVAIARALANSPKVLLCDEATSALDPQTTKSILKLLKRVNEELGITIVLITHEMAVIKEICDRVAVMENGHVVEEGNIVDIFTNPHAEVTRNFIASTSNLSQIYEMVEQGSDLTRLQSGEVLVRLHYGGTGTGKPLISEISRKFNVNTNIIFGNVEVLHHIPLGDLIMILGGEQVDEALHYMKEHDVDVEVINKC